jgi:hypothetical protein
MKTKFLLLILVLIRELIKFVENNSYDEMRYSRTSQSLLIISAMIADQPLVTASTLSIPKLKTNKCKTKLKLNGSEN